MTPARTSEMIPSPLGERVRERGKLRVRGQRTRTWRPPTDAGFTLLELLAVLALMALATFLFVPQTAGVRGPLLLRAAAQDAGTALRAVRSAALRSNREQTLVIDPGTRAYWADSVVARRTLPAGLAVVATAEAGHDPGGNAIVRVRFRPDGTSTGGRIELAGAGRTAIVTVDWLTGATTVAWGP